MFDRQALKTKWQKRFAGVRGQIWLACLSFAALTLVASGIALWNFASARHTIGRIAGSNVPQMQQIDAVTLQFTNLMALAPAIGVAKDSAHLDIITTQQQQLSQALEQRLNALKQSQDLQLGLVNSLAQDGEKLIINLDMLVVARRAQLDLNEQLKKRIDETRNWVDALRIALTPLASALAQAPERRPQLYAVQELKTEIHLIYALLTRIASADDETGLRALTIELRDALARADLRLQEMPSGAARDVLLRGRDGLDRIANGDDNVSLLRQRRLAADQTNAHYQLSHRDIAERLQRSLSQLTQIANSEVSETAESVDNAFGKMRSTLALLSIVAVLTSIVAAVLFAGPLFGNRLSRLSKTVEAFADGQWQAEISDHQNDEIGRLAEALRSLRNLALERQRIEQRLAQLANFDALTGLPNRSALLTNAEQWINRCERNAMRFALLFIDLDRFKMVNDTQGHEVGDNLLRTIATRLSQLLRRADVLARLGGDEFVVLAEFHNEHDDAETVAKKIIDELSEAIQLGEHSYYLGASIGISIYPDDGKQFAELLRKADTAMYIAKQQGGNTLAFYRDEMNLHATRRIELEADLRQAVEDRALELWYQPKADLRNGCLAGAEALVRWRHPVRGMISPMEFVPLAEEIGLIDDIGLWVLQQAARDCQRWRQQFEMDICVAVNLSPRQLLHPKQLSKTIRQSLTEVGLPPSAIELEVTESVLMKNLHDAVNALRELQSVGHRIAVDDFGTGYSSLSYIKNLPIDVIKIDKAFVRGLPKDKGDAAVAGAILGIARALNLTVVAEGVETNEQLQFLRERKCHLVQGYLIAKPLPVNEFEAFVQRVRYGGLLDDDVAPEALP